jgi:hypothetical protein
MKHTILIALLICALLIIPTVFAAVSTSNSSVDWGNRLIIAKEKMTLIKNNSLAKERLQKLNITTTQKALGSFTNDQLATAIQNNAAKNFVAWKQEWKELKPTVVSTAKKNVIAYRLVQAYKAKSKKELDDWVENKPILASACQTELDAVKTLAAEAANTTVLVANISEISAEDETIAANANVTQELSEAKTARKELVKCLAGKGLDIALANAKERVQNRLEMHNQFATIIDNALSKLAELKALRESKGLPADFSTFQNRLEKLKTVNNNFIARANALLAENPIEPKEKVHFLNKMNNFVSTSHKFQTAIKKALQWFVKVHNIYNYQQQSQTDVSEAQTELATVAIEIDDIQTELTASVEQLPEPTNADPIVKTITGETTAEGTA